LVISADESAATALEIAIQQTSKRNNVLDMGADYRDFRKQENPFSRQLFMTIFGLPTVNRRNKPAWNNGPTLFCQS